MTALAYLAPVLVFGLVIFVHELGHFLAAKALGVYAPRFSIGFGPAIFRMRRGETEYVLAMLPIGGYVRMASRLDEETAFLEGGAEEGTRQTSGDDPGAMIPFGPKPVPEDRWFESKPLIARIVIMVAGVTMNVILALVVSILIAFHDGRQVVPTTTIMRVTPLETLGELSQLHAGDTIRSINGTHVATWNDVENLLEANPPVADIATQQGDVRLPLAAKGVSGATVLGALEFFIPPVLDSIVPDSPAALSGFQHGDSIVSIDGTPIRSWSDLQTRVSPSAGTPLSVQVSRAGALRSITVTPKPMGPSDSVSGSDTGTPAGKIGATPQIPVRRESLGLGSGVGAGVRMTMGMAGLIFGFLHDIAVGHVSVRQLGGPIAITRMSYSAARSGLEQLFYLIAVLSINVAILNLLPVPILDGGQILINVLESAKGSPFSVRTREYILRFGLVMIGLLFAVVMYNDTREWFVQLFGWVGRMVS